MDKKLFVIVLAVYSVLTSTFAESQWDCLCSLKTKVNVFPDASGQGKPIGVLNENDCISLWTDNRDNAGTAGWWTVEFDLRMGYVANNTNIQIVGCYCFPDDMRQKSEGWTKTTTPTSAVNQRMSSYVTMTTTPMAHTAGTPGAQYGCPLKHFDLSSVTDIGVLFTVEDKCFKIIPTYHSWTNSEADCKRRGGHLATIDTAEKQTLIYRFLSSFESESVWIGLHDRDNEEQFKWVSGQSVNYTNWEPNQYHDQHNISNCVVLRTPLHHEGNGTWFKRVCCEKNNYICEFDAVTGNEIGTNMATNEDGDLHMCSLQLMSDAKLSGGIMAQHGNSCYVLQRGSYSYTFGFCWMSGDLASINNADEQAFIQDFMMRHNPNKAVRIGLDDCDEKGAFEWNNGDPLTYTNWLIGHEDTFAGHNVNHCVVLLPYRNGTWDDIECDCGWRNNGQYSWLCEHAMVSKIPGATIVG